MELDRMFRMGLDRSFTAPAMGSLGTTPSVKFS